MSLNAHFEIKRTALAMVAVGVVGVSTLGSCAEVADLGEKAKLQSDASTSTRRCGTAIDVNIASACSTCTDDHCCPEQNLCSDEPRCKEAIRCIVDCGYELTCTALCNGKYQDNDSYRNLAACVTANCQSLCFPGAKCQALGACCAQLKDELLRRQCGSVVTYFDEARCESVTQQFCAVADAGGDAARE